MKIAILGWGSLIWRPETLHYDKSLGWQKDGPKLPIEFARISSDGRLTLVIKEGVPNISTLYSISLYKDLDIAILDLAVREGCCKNKIGFYQRDEKASFPKGNLDYYKNTLRDWMNNHPEFDAFVWTNLSGNFKDKMGSDLLPETAVSYLENLPLDIQAKAEEYIRKAPKQIYTPIRIAIEKALGWSCISG